MSWEIRQGDAREVLRTLPEESVQCVVTSPPYWGLRDYGVEGQLGLEPTPEQYVANLVELFREVRRVLRPDGVVWLNLGDCYATGAGKVGDHPGGGEQGKRWAGMAGHRGARSGSKKHADGAVGPMVQPNRLPIPGLKPKDLVMAPARAALALQADGWWVRSDTIWSKPNPMPESVQDRPTRSHEYVFLLSKSARYFYDADAIREEGVWAGQNRTDRGPRESAMPGAPPHNGLRSDKQRAIGEQQGAMRGGDRLSGFNERWKGAKANGDMEPGRNRRSVWEIATQPYPEAHFATFPEKLVEPCILAGSSPKACGECGAPWERQTVREGSKPYRTGKSAEKVAQGLVTAFSGYEDGSSSPTFRTVGWNPTCSHGYERHDDVSDSGTARCTVLDPFAGSGTVGVVTQRHDRDFIGIELNPEYVELARNRIVDDAPLLNAQEAA